ncbi:MAG: mannitol dehydrogenase family protein [Rhodospirillaceae bacterium]|nr:mannitol dehydrogenase family protein [Rhodospirillaceae bacterium]
MTARLNNDALDRLPADVGRPGYDRGRAGIGIVHLGLGAFHRAHQAVYTDDVMGREGGDWAISGVSLRHGDTRCALAPQDGLYTVAVRSGEPDRLRVIGSVREILVAPEQPEAVLARLIAPQTRIVTLTVTEKGYCHDPATGELRLDDAGIRHDLAHPDRPHTVIGYLVAALARRRTAGTAPFTPLTCDNLPANGRTLGRLVLAYARALDGGLADWIGQAVPFPSTMVDRIVPATTQDDRAAVDARLGLADAWPVVTEPFTQWVIEDRFAGPRPAWELAGAELVEDVEPYEHMKLRLLNGSHSTMAYLGYLAGYETIAETMADPAFVTLIGRMMDREVTPTLTVPASADLGRYKAALLDRFANPGLKHRTWQIAMDGSQKLPQRLLGTVRDRLAAGRSIARLALAVAGWMRYVTGIDEAGRPIEVSDPLAGDLRRLADQAGRDPAALADALLSVKAVFGSDLPQNMAFRSTVTSALGTLIHQGARATVAAYAGMSSGPGCGG